jgi:two-component system sensor histidine kinase CpxA
MDKVAIKSALENIIRNALKFAKSVVNIQLKVSKSGKRVIVIIDDDGAGVSEEQLLLLFEPFYRAKTSDTQNEENNGTGLGLAIAKAAIDAHNGEIQAKLSDLGGLSMTVSLPKE